MNRAYKLVWNSIFGSWVVASELAKGKKKSSAKTLTAALVLLAAGAGVTAQAATPAANALPVFSQVLSGFVSTDYSTANQLTVNQSSNHGWIKWSSFDVGSNAKVIFNQPSSSSYTYNIVTSASPTQILGQVQANGHFVIGNPAGIVFAAGSQVNAAAIVATANSEWYINTNTNAYGFLAATNTNARVENHGTLTATAGPVTLLGPNVVNTGTITATGGHINLINAGNVSFTNSVPFISSDSTITGVIQNSGTLQATAVSGVGGRILLTGDTSQAGSKISLGGTLLADDQVYGRGKNVVIDRALSTNALTTLNATDNFNINADLTVAADKTLNIGYGSDAGEDYFLNYGAKVNLSGASAGFSVNNQAYTVIQDVTQLQNISSNLSGRYVLGSDIDASISADWDNGRGFNPLGNSTTAFSGKFDGLGHSINQLNINRPTTDYVGLFGASQNAVLRNVGLTAASISGRSYVGGLVGKNTADGATSQIVNNHVAGTITGNTATGGLVGYNLASNSGNASLSRNYSLATVNGLSGSNEYTAIGGLIGRNEALNGGTANVEQNFVNAAVIAAGGGIGGLVGYNSAANANANIRYNYVLGSVSAPGWDIGGLVGENNQANGGSATISFNYFGGTVDSVDVYRGAFAGWNVNLTTQINDNYWNSEVASNIEATGNGLGTRNVGLTTAQSTQLSSYGNWAGLIDAQGSTSTVWRIYNGASAPLLRVFMKPLTVTADSVTRTYDATEFYNGSYSLSDAAANTAKIYGAAVYQGSAIGARNAGSYNLTVSGLYSDQFGYDIGFADGTVDINKAALSISSTDVSKTYDGTTTAKGTAVVSAGSLYGTDSIAGGTFTYADKNAGTGKSVAVSGVTLNDGNNGGNYDVTYVDNTGSSISKRLLTITAQAYSKEYDGKLTSAGKPVVVGRQRGDSIAGLTQSYLNKNAGTGKTINVDAAYTIRDGNGGNNYDVVIVNSTAGVITPKALTISTVANSKVYDGGITSANKPLVTGLITGDRVTGLFQQYESKTVGENKQLLIKNGYVVQDGYAGGNYTVTEQTSNNGVITEH